MNNNLQLTLMLEQVLNIKGMGFPQCLLLKDTWWIDLMVLLKIKEFSMIFVCQIAKTLTTDSRAWTLAFRPWINRLKLFRTRSLSCNMARMTEEKQPVECSKQPIVFAL